MLCSSSSSLMASENLGGTVIPQSQLSHGLDNRTSSAGSWFLNNILPFLFFHQLTVLRLSIVVLISSRMGHSSMKSVLIHRCSLIIYTIKWISQCRCLREIYHAYFIRNDSQSQRADTVVSDFTIGESLPKVWMEQWTDWFLLSLSVGCTCGVGKKVSQTQMRFMSAFETFISITKVKSQLAWPRSRSMGSLTCLSGAKGKLWALERQWLRLNSAYTWHLHALELIIKTKHCDLDIWPVAKILTT